MALALAGAILGWGRGNVFDRGPLAAPLPVVIDIVVARVAAAAACPRVGVLGFVVIRVCLELASLPQVRTAQNLTDLPRSSWFIPTVMSAVSSQGIRSAARRVAALQAMLNMTRFR